ncbi:uncharacterized protein LY89DRAFT_646183 [Mollisia scopiformis]|uniref:Beta-mannosidase n=1 Tax=Mollisia scopiformis TaxID=149040 RepID=A0A194XA96_MOLSC|nr:uncharacterized protein LY89DRAFT_646183 [Mollisia scopiformis]KUJ17064.1 hypothetical protein LY89DRAFT_646183 [Mollisia scopiformis]
MEFPQRKIYKIVERLCPDVQYWANSPWGGAKEANDPTIGDIHQWDGTFSRSYQDYKHLSGRFVSEFGMHGYPDMRTVNEFVPNPQDRHPQSRAIDSHKGHLAETRIARYLAENFRYSNELEKFANVSQLMQSEAYGYACRDWKRKFGGKGKESCAGLIIWQLNDVYPCTSWVFYTIKKSFAPISIGIERTPWSRWIDDDHPRMTEIPSFETFAHNTTPFEKKFTLSLSAYDMYKHEYITLPPDHAAQEVTLEPGQNTELGSLAMLKSVGEESLIILAASLVNDKREVEARIVNWPEPFRYLSWHEDTRVSVAVREQGER